MEFKKYLPRRHFQHILSTPIIYGMFFPLLLLDVTMEIYHRICFPLYGLEYIPRCRYIKIDRHRLKYLNLWERFNCLYCGYANGLLHYISMIAAETERYWCSIKHEKKYGFKQPAHHSKFLPFDDKKALEKLVSDA